MKKLKGALLLAQSGGPTCVINSTASGVFLTALKHKRIITNVYGAKNGIIGILNEEFYDISKERKKELKLLKNTPSSLIGSARLKLDDPDKNKTNYIKLLNIFKKYNIRYFFYNGGNDSMNTVYKISKFMKENDWEMRILGIPKTIDNDIENIDHTPGYASAARYIATSFMEIYKDSIVYNKPQVTIVEVMGRDSGWLSASSILAKEKGYGPDLFYLPEVVFSEKTFLNDIKKILKTKNNCLIVLSEGVKYSDGKYITEHYKNLNIDPFGHSQLGGSAAILAQLVRDKLNIKVKNIEFSILQRSASHLASGVDIKEAFNVGRLAVINGLKGETDKMISIKRIKNNPYTVNYPLVPLEKVSNTERKLPLNWILKDNTGLTKDFIDYIKPLIEGDPKISYKNGLPVYAKLKLELIKKR